jgi:DNA-binding transcriptional LysR family regulator
MGTPDLDDLVAFVAVAETRSFSGAARRLELPKSTVSRAVARLEDALDVQLVHRTTRSVALSTAGAALYEKVVAPISSLRQSVGELPAQEEQLSGGIRVTAPLDFGAAVLADVVRRFVARHPHVEVDLRLTNEHVDLVAEGIDVGIRFALHRLKDSSLHARRICPSTLQLFASPAYLARRGVPRMPRDLDDHDWVRFRSVTKLRLDAPDAHAEVVPRGRILSNDMFFIHAALLQDAGLGALPTFLADPDVTAGRLVRVLPRWTIQSAFVWIVRPGGRNVAPKVSAFIELVLETLRARGFVPRSSVADGAVVGKA